MKNKRILLFATSLCAMLGIVFAITPANVIKADEVEDLDPIVEPNPFTQLLSSVSLTGVDVSIADYGVGAWDSGLLYYDSGFYSELVITNNGYYLVGTGTIPRVTFESTGEYGRFLGFKEYSTRGALDNNKTLVYPYITPDYVPGDSFNLSLQASTHFFFRIVYDPTVFEQKVPVIVVNNGLVTISNYQSECTYKLYVNDSLVGTFDSDTYSNPAVGKIYVTSTYDGTTLTSAVYNTPKLSTPIISAISSNDSIVVTWSSVSNASSYEVYLMRSNASSYELVGTVNNTRYTGIVYGSYKIKALPSSSSYVYQASDFSNVVIVNPDGPVDPPEDVTLSTPTASLTTRNGAVVLSITDLDSDANTLYIYRNGSLYSQVSITNMQDFIITDFASYSVKAVDLSGVYITSDMSDAVTPNDAQKTIILNYVKNNAGDGLGFKDLLVAVVDVPVNTFSSLLNFDLLGVNLFDLATSLISLALLIIVLKKVL